MNLVWLLLVSYFESLVRNEKKENAIVLQSICLETVYLAFCWKLFDESGLEYTCTLKKIENVRKIGKIWDFKKLYIKK